MNIHFFIAQYVVCLHGPTKATSSIQYMSTVNLKNADTAI